jgi:replicative DNA helicase
MSTKPNEQTIRDEEGLIGGLLCKPAEFYRAAEHVSAVDFSDDGLGLLFATMQALLAANVPLTSTNVTRELIRAKVIDRIGGLVRVPELLKDGQPHHIQYYAEQVAKHSQTRRLRAVVAAIAKELEEPNAEPQAIAEQAQSAILEASAVRLQDIRSAGEICLEEFERLEILRTSGASGVLATGIPCIDIALSGGLPVGVTILAARTSIGKSALAVQIGCRVAERGDPVVFISLEMSESQNAQRLLSMYTKIPTSRIQSATYSQDDSTRLYKASADIQNFPLRIWQAAGANALRIESMLRTAKAKFGAQLAVIDYLGLVAGDSRNSIYERTTNNSQAFSTMAKRLGLPILLLCQLNRLAEGEIPEVHHLRDSGSIEQDAEAICLLHREDRDSQDAELFVEKNRQGRKLATKLKFENGWFSDPNEAFAKDFEFSGGYRDR